MGGGGSYHADRVPRDQNVGVGRLAAAVQHDSVHPVRENEEGAFGREHGDRAAGEVCYVMSPDSAGVNGYRGMVFGAFSDLFVVDAHPRHSAAILQDFGYFGISQDFCSVELGIVDIGGAKSERVDGSVRNPHCANYVRIDRWLKAFRLFRVDDFCLDPRIETGLYEFCLI